MIISVLKGFYPYFLPLVFFGIFLRIREKRWSRAETLLALLVLGHAVLMLLQIAAGGGDFSRRYLLTSVPLLFGWAGYALRRLSSCRFFLPAAAVCCLLLFSDAMRPSLEYLWKRSKKEECAVIRSLSWVLRNDWQSQGREPFYAPEIRWDDYCSPKCPLVRCDDFPFLGYASGGSGTAGDAVLPQPDYRVFVNSPVELPYTEIGRFVYHGTVYRAGRRLK